MVVEWILKLLTERLYLQALGQQLLLEVVNFLTEISYLGGLRFDNAQLALQVRYLEFEEADVFKAFLVLNFTLAEGGLKNFYLLVEQGEFIITTDQLSTKDISLIYHILIVLLQLFMFLMSFLNNVG